MRTIVRIFISMLSITFVFELKAQSTIQDTRVTVKSGEWELIGDLEIPDTGEDIPVVLMLNKAAGDRTVYKELAGHLKERGIASLRLDLRGHGESINVEAFIPGKQSPDPLIWDSEVDVKAAIDFLIDQPKLDADRIGVIGGSYSGEEMAEAGRLYGYVNAYVELSPGSFSDESIDGIDTSGVPWLFIVSKNEPHLKEITALVQKKSETVELVIVPGYEHATRLLPDRPELAEWIAVWLSKVL